ncbi:MAG TPA: polyprenyl diphosphate synthase [Pseudonocardia sp.]
MLSRVRLGSAGRVARRVARWASKPAYRLYTNRLRRSLVVGPLPAHVGLIMDGNRRWARQMGMADTSMGHHAGAEHIENVLGWCEAVGIEHVTVFVCSTENLHRRGTTEIAFLMRVIEQVVAPRLAHPGLRWRVRLAGMLDALPDTTARALKDAVEATRDRRAGEVTLAVGYGGRQEVVDALRELLYERARAGQSLRELATSVSIDDIAPYLYTAGQPDPELIIRTSGEQRMSNFLLWQSAYAQLHFCEAYWPAFREVDFLRALRGYRARQHH